MSLTLVDYPNLSWPRLSVIFQRLSSLLSNNGVTSFLKQTKHMKGKQQTYEGLKITVSSKTTGNSFFFHIKSDTFIQIVLGL